MLIRDWIAALVVVSATCAVQAGVTNSTSYQGYAISVQSSFGSYQSLVDRDVTDGAPAYDYSVNVIRTDVNNGNTHRAFTGGRWRVGASGIDGDHILQWKSSDGSPDTWSMTRSGPEFLHGSAIGYTNEWWSSNVMDAEVLKAEDGKWIMMVQVMINPGRPLDIPGLYANRPADRIMLLTADSLDGTWARKTDRSVMTNITDPANTHIHHPELIYVPWDADGGKYWLYFAKHVGGVFKGIWRIRSNDYTAFDFTTQERVRGMKGIGNQIGYLEEAPGGPMFVRITNRPESALGRDVPSLQFSRNGLSWNSPAEILLEGSDDGANKDCKYLGIATYLGRGGLESIGSNQWRVVYAATTEGASIWTTEIGSGSLVLGMAAPDALYHENFDDEGTGATAYNDATTPEVNVGGIGTLESTGASQGGNAENTAWKLNVAGSGGRGLRFGDEYNWATGANSNAILTAGGFSISLDYTIVGADPTQWVSMRLANNGELDDGVNNLRTDFGVLARGNGRITTFENAASQVFGTASANAPRSAEFIFEFDSWAAGATVTFTGIIDGVIIASDTFTWDKMDDMQILFGGINEGALIDNITVSTILEPVTTGI